MCPLQRIYPLARLCRKLSKVYVVVEKPPWCREPGRR